MGNHHRVLLHDRRSCFRLRLCLCLLVQREYFNLGRNSGALRCRAGRRPRVLGSLAHEPRERGDRSPGADTVRSCWKRHSSLLDLDAGKHDVRRRSLLTWMCGAFEAVFVASIASLFRSLGAAPERSLHDTIWKSGQRLMTPEGTPVSIHALQPGSTMVVFPEDSIGNEKAQTVLVRVDEQFLKMPKNMHGLGATRLSRVLAGLHACGMSRRSVSTGCAAGQRCRRRPLMNLC